MTCKGICIRHKAKKPLTGSRYGNGQKRCQICDIFMETPAIFCICCGYKMRTMPRSKKFKAKIRAQITA